MRSGLPKSASFRTRDGVEVDGSAAIFPIVHKIGSDFLIIGTGFFVGTEGLFVTARHVLMNGARPHDPLWAVHFYQPGHYFMRPIHKVLIHNSADVAAGVVAQMKHNTTGALLRNKVVTLTNNTPKIGTVAATFAYPKSSVRAENGKTRLNIETSWHYGRIVEHFPNGRDRVLLPNECYQTDVEVLSGASGGPMADENGKIFGINSTGFDGTEISFASSIRCILPMGIDDVNVKGRRYARITIQEIVDLGLIAME